MSTETSRHLWADPLWAVPKFTLCLRASSTGTAVAMLFMVMDMARSRAHDEGVLKVQARGAQARFAGTIKG